MRLLILDIIRRLWVLPERLLLQAETLNFTIPSTGYTTAAQSTAVGVSDGLLVHSQPCQFDFLGDHKYKHFLQYPKGISPE